MHRIAHLIDGGWLCPPCAARRTPFDPDPETTALIGDETDAPRFCTACGALLTFGLTADGRHYVWAEVVAAVAGAVSRRPWFDVARCVGLGGAEDMPAFDKRDICDAWYAYALRRPPDDGRRAVILRRLEDIGYTPSPRHREMCDVRTGFVSLSDNGRAILARLEAADLDVGPPRRVPLNLRVATGCGHRLPIPPMAGGAGYGTSSSSYTYCYPCLDGAERISMASANDAWAYVGSGEDVTTWPGAVLGRVVERRAGRGRYTSSGFWRTVTYRVRDLDGGLWYGRNPDAGGTLIHLRRMRSGAAA